MRANKKTLDCRGSQFEIKTVGGDTFVQGWANKCVVDRGKDIINKDAWNLDNYKKVPTILFNHDKDKPIGKAVDVRPTDQGLWIKAKISNSKDPEISKIRDLINEGMLNAFSVGFDAQDEQKNAEGVNEIKQAELYEVSIVTLPMNQDSTFDVTTKSLQNLSKEKAISQILKVKGAWVAEAVHGKIYDMEKSGQPRDELLSKICTAAGIDKDVLAQVLSGNLTPVPENVLGALAEVLELDLNKLQKLDAGDVKVQQSGEKPMNGEQEDCYKDGEAPSAGAPGKPEIIGITIPKDQAEDGDAAQQMVSQAGFEPKGVQESDEGWYVLLVDPSEFGDQTAQLDLGDGAIATVGMRASSEPKAMEEDQEDKAGTKPPLDPSVSSEEEPKTPPPPMADPQGKPPAPPKDPGETAPPPPPHPAAAPAKEPAAPPPADKPAAGEKPPAEAPADSQGDADQAKADYEAFKKDEAAAADGKPGSVPSWVADEALWAKAQAASQAAAGKADYAFMVWWYLQNGGGKKSDSTSREKAVKDAPMTGGGDATIPIDDNPYLAQARQTNILLGVLIEEFRQMCATMQGQAIQPPVKSADPEEPVEVDGELEKQVSANLKKYLVHLDEKLKKLGA